MKDTNSYIISYNCLWIYNSFKMKSLKIRRGVYIVTTNRITQLDWGKEILTHPERWKWIIEAVTNKIGEKTKQKDSRKWVSALTNLRESWDMKMPSLGKSMRHVEIKIRKSIISKYILQSTTHSPQSLQTKTNTWHQIIRYSPHPFHNPTPPSPLSIPPSAHKWFPF